MSFFDDIDAGKIVTEQYLRENGWWESDGIFIKYDHINFYDIKFTYDVHNNNMVCSLHTITIGSTKIEYIDDIDEFVDRCKTRMYQAYVDNYVK